MREGGPPREKLSERRVRRVAGEGSEGALAKKRAVDEIRSVRETLFPDMPGPFGPESPPQGEELEELDAVNAALEEECMRLGLEKGTEHEYMPLSPEQVRIVRGVSWLSSAGMRPVSGMYWPLSNKVFLPELAKDKFAAEIHEAIHSNEYFTYGSIRDNPNFGTVALRGSYALYDARDRRGIETGQRQFFSAFRDGVVEDLTAKVYPDALQKAKETNPSADIPPYSHIAIYENNRWLFRYVVSRVASHEKRSEDDVADEYYRGLFTGNMMHMRKIPAAFGEKMPHRDALLVISLLHADSEWQPKDVLAYFNARSLSEELEEGNRLFSEQGLPEARSYFLAHAALSEIERLVQKGVPKIVDAAYFQRLADAQSALELKIRYLSELKTAGAGVSKAQILSRQMIKHVETLRQIADARMLAQANAQGL